MGIHLVGPSESGSASGVGGKAISITAPRMPSSGLQFISLYDDMSICEYAIPRLTFERAIMLDALVTSQFDHTI
jgi:hypothetical protein